MRPYRVVLGVADYRRLWLGSTVSALGDGMTWTALAWLVVSRGEVAALGWLTVCYTAPVLLGGLAVGPLLDRLPKRRLLLADSVFRGLVVGLVPLLDAAGRLRTWHLLAVAAVYGLLKMLPLAGVPAAVPDVVDESLLPAANGLEALGYGVAGMVGPALAGVLIGRIGAAQVLALDAASYLAFAVLLARLGSPLPPAPGRDRPVVSGHGWRPALRVVLGDRVILGIMLAFMAFNVAEGMLLVVAPWLAAFRLPEGAASLGLLLAALAAGELVGSALAGGVDPRRDLLVRIALAQLAASVGLLGVLAPRLVVAALGLACVGCCSAPMTVWAQTVRMRRLPAQVRGRAFTLMRTLMQFTPPLGAALAAPLLARGRLGWTVALMVALAGLPAVALLVRAPGWAGTPPPVASVSGAEDR